MTRVGKLKVGIRKRNTQTGEKIESIFENDEVLSKVSQYYDTYGFTYVINGEDSINDIHNEIVNYLNL